MFEGRIPKAWDRLFNLTLRPEVCVGSILVFTSCRGTVGRTNRAHVVVGVVDAPTTKICLESVDRCSWRYALTRLYLSEEG